MEQIYKNFMKMSLGNRRLLQEGSMEQQSCSILPSMFLQRSPAPAGVSIQYYENDHQKRFIGTPEPGS